MLVTRRRARVSAPRALGVDEQRLHEVTKPTPRWRRLSTVLVVITTAVVVVAVTVGVTRAHGTPASAPAGVRPTSSGGVTLLQAVTQIDPAVVRAVGSGGVSDSLLSLRGAPVLLDTASKLPIVYVVTSEPCVDCAAQRWPLVVALSRFGTFAGLPLLAIPAGNSSPALATFSFASVTFSSKYIRFASSELKDLSGKALQAVTPDGQKLLSKYDAPPYVAASVAGYIPWLDIADRYALQGTGFSPLVIGNLDWGHVAAQFTNASSSITKAIVGEANYITAAICTVTSMQPANVCQAAPIPGLIAQLPAAGSGAQP